jgi:hypothetical protein
MWDRILYIGKWIAGVGSGIAVLISVIMFVYSQGQKTERDKFKDTSTELKVDKLIISDSIKNVKIDQILSNQNQFLSSQKDITRSLNNLNNSYINHLKNDKKVDQLIEYLESVKKNGELNLFPTVYRPTR